MAKAIPVFRVFDYDKAVAFYIAWLGFKIEWEHKPEEGRFCIQASLGELVIQLLEHPDQGGTGTWVILSDFKNLVAYRKLILLKGSSFVKPELRQVPREPNTLSMTMVDPFYNRIEFRETMRK